jgi:hypothetical protein
MADARVNHIVTNLNEAAQLIRQMVEASTVEPVVEKTRSAASTLGEAIMEKLKLPV